MEGGKIKKIIFLAVTLVVIANLLLGNNVSAKKLELNEAEVEKIKLVLDLTKLISSIAVSDDKLKMVLNMMIKSGEVSTNITYGLLALSALNEIEFIDLVISGRYREESRQYFDKVLDEKLNLRNYYKGIGYDLPRVLAGKITSPIAALTLNAFDITNKTIDVLIALENVKRVETYNGLWVYFDFRRGNEPHEVAWDYAQTRMGFAVITDWSFSFKKPSNERASKLELQFAALWDKWGENTDSQGVKKEFKEQVKKELANTLASAIKTETLVEREKESTILEKIKITLENLIKKAEKAGISFKEEIIKINTKIQELVGLGGAQVSQSSEGQIEMGETGETGKMGGGDEKGEMKGMGEIEQLETVKPETELIPNEIQEILDDVTEKIAKIENTEPLATTTEMENEPIVVKPQSVSLGVCEKVSGSQPLRNGVIFNEIAWMGSQNSANDEWMELKNISGSEINLTGWQILDKDGQIKIIFGGGRTSANGLFLLERTDDNSLPGVTADLIYTGALNDDNEALYLFDNNCQLTDEVAANPDWPAGQKTNRYPMERKDDLTWQTSADSGGTPKRANSSGYVFSYSAAPPSLPPSPVVSPPPSLKILITEVQISPNGERFIEIYNPNSQAVNLTGWYIQRKTQTGNSWNSFVSSANFEGKTIGNLGYFLISSSSQADIVLNLTLTEGNSLILKNSDQEIIDKVGWGAAQEFETTPTENPLAGKTIGRKNNLDTDNNQNDFEIQTPTPGEKNKSPVAYQNQAPLAQFAFAPENPTVSQEVIFDASSSTDSDGQITNYFWDFGNGVNVNGNATSAYSYSSSTDFTIILQVTDDKGATSSFFTIITVAEEPQSLKVVINEIAWMGTSATNSSNEWIELYNNTTSTIDLSNWALTSFDGSPNITFSTSSIPGNSFYLIERTDETTISDISADLIYTGALENNGEKLELRDADGNLIDLVDFSAGWPAGTTSPAYISMERINSTFVATSTNWASNNLLTRNGLDAFGNKINGTPRAQNSASVSSTAISELLFDEFSEITLTKLGSPYIIQQSLLVPTEKILKIEPGASLKFDDSKEIEVKGNLEALGKETEKIIFTRSAASIPGNDRYRINFTDSQNSKIENANFIDGGRLTYVPFYNPGGLISGVMDIENSRVSIKNSSIIGAFPRGINGLNSTTSLENSTLEGIKDSISFFNTAAFLIDGGSLLVASSTFKSNTIGIKITGGRPQIENNIFQENTTPIYLAGASFPIFSGNSAQNNNLNGILVDNSGIIDDTVWQADLPYVIGGNKSISAKLTLKQGVIVKFKSGGYLNIAGQLLTEGILANPVVFTSISDDEFGGDTNNNGASTLPQKGDWQRIEITSQAATSTLEGVKIRYGGGGCSIGFCWGAILQSAGAGIEIKNSVIEKNIWGIFSNESDCSNVFQKIKLANNIFSNNDLNIHLGYGNTCPPS